MQSKQGMTLIELLIVLALMAGLAGVALTTAGSMGHRGRYDETTARMQLIRRAIVADDGEPGRFVRDMGRLPIRFSATEGKELEELWLNMSGLGYGAFSNSVVWAGAPKAATNNVTLRAGWNGPYLSAINDPADATYFDGFGHAWHIQTNATGRILTVSTLGADGTIGGTGWENEDRTLDFQALLPDTSLTVHVKALSSTNMHTAVWQPVVVGSGDAPYQVDILGVGLYYPDVSDTNRVVSLETRTNTPAVFTGLMPTTVRVFAYSTGADQMSGAEPEWVTLRSGANTITLYLREATP